MKRTIIAVSLLLVVGLSIGCTKRQAGARVGVPMTFMGLEEGEPRSQVVAALQKMHYRPLACKPIDWAGEKCTTRSQNYQFELAFVDGRLSRFEFRYPASEHDEFYQMLVKSLGQPTDFLGKKGAETFVWKSEGRVCEVGCAAAETLGLSPPENGEPNGTVFLFGTRYAQSG
jgi:hypothetical protein